MPSNKQHSGLLPSTATAILLLVLLSATTSVAQDTTAQRPVIAMQQNIILPTPEENSKDECFPPEENSHHHHLFNNPLVVTLSTFGIELVDESDKTTKIDKSNHVNQCLSAMAPDTLFLDQCMSVLPLAFGKEGILTKFQQISSILVPTISILTAGSSIDDFQGAVQKLSRELNRDNMSDMCSAMETSMPCLLNIYDALEGWIDAAEDCCLTLSSEILPPGSTWAGFLTDLTTASINAVCTKSSSCSETVCGESVINSLGSKEGDGSSLIENYLTIPQEQTCAALSGKEVDNKTLGFDIGCQCSNAVLDLSTVFSKIPMYNAALTGFAHSNCVGIMSNSVEMMPENDMCYNFPAGVSCECTDDCDANDWGATATVVDRIEDEGTSDTTRSVGGDDSGNTSSDTGSTSSGRALSSPSFLPYIISALVIIMALRF